MQRKTDLTTSPSNDDIRTDVSPQSGLIELLYDVDMQRCIFDYGCYSYKISRSVVSYYTGIDLEDIVNWESGKNNLSQTQIEKLLAVSHGQLLHS